MIKGYIFIYYVDGDSKDVLIFRIFHELEDYETSVNISSIYYSIDILTDTLNPGTYIITCDMIGFENDKFLKIIKLR